MLTGRYTGRPAVDHLISAVDQLHLEFELVASPAPLPAGFKAVQITAKTGAYLCLVDDEYSDIDGTNHPRALQAVLLSAFEMNDCQTADEWLENNGFAGDLTIYRSMLEGLQDFWDAYRQNVSDPGLTVSDFSWQLSSDDADVLRSLPPHHAALERGFRLDIQRFVFAFLLFFAGLIFVFLAKWTGWDILGLGAVFTTIAALGYLISAFSKIPKQE